MSISTWPYGKGTITASHAMIFELALALSSDHRSHGGKRVSPRKGDRTAAEIRGAAVRLFFRHGYEATTIRDLADDVGIKVGSIYNHFPGKEDLLFSIMSEVMRDLLAAIEQAQMSYAAPVDQLRSVIECSVVFHGERAEEVFIGNSELRSLTRPRRATVVDLRDQLEAVYVSLLERGSKAGDFHVTDARLVSYAIIAMSMHVSNWYAAGGRMSLDEIASIYSDLALRAVTNSDRQVDLGDLIAAKSASTPST